MPSKTTQKESTQKSSQPKSSQPKSSQLDDDCRVANLSPVALSLMAGFFKVLSEASRLQIVCVLKAGSKNVTEIIEATGLGQANVSKHLKMLAQAGVVSRQQQGVSAYYQIANPFVFELCELVCDALSIQIEHQNQQFEQLDVIRQGR
ncbi:MAG: metalloregulator ArsR/SmtB family transcription factor [Cyanobacteria bacterium P01_A01_bin.123]